MNPGIVLVTMTWVLWLKNHYLWSNRIIYGQTIDLWSDHYLWSNTFYSDLLFAQCLHSLSKDATVMATCKPCGKTGLYPGGVRTNSRSPFKFRLIGSPLEHVFPRSKILWQLSMYRSPLALSWRFCIVEGPCSATNIVK